MFGDGIAVISRVLLCVLVVDLVMVMGIEVGALLADLISLTTSLPVF